VLEKLIDLGFQLEVSLAQHKSPSGVSNETEVGGPAHRL